VIYTRLARYLRNHLQRTTNFYTTHTDHNIPISYIVTGSFHQVVRTLRVDLFHGREDVQPLYQEPTKRMLFIGSIKAIFYVYFSFSGFFVFSDFFLLFVVS